MYSTICLSVVSKVHTLIERCEATLRHLVGLFAQYLDKRIFKCDHVWARTFTCIHGQVLGSFKAALLMSDFRADRAAVVAEHVPRLWSSKSPSLLHAFLLILLLRHQIHLTIP